MVACSSCWKGWRRLFQGSGHIELEHEDCTRAFTDREVKVGFQTPERNAAGGCPGRAPPPASLGPFEEELPKPEQPVKLLQMDPGIHAIHRGADTFHRDGAGSPVKTASLPNVWAYPVMTPTGLAMSPVSMTSAPASLGFHSPVAMHVPTSPSLLQAPPGLGMGHLANLNPGSMLHGTGTCSPCAWYWKPKSCLNAQGCAFCHLCPDGELKARKKAKHAARRGVPLTPKQLGMEDRDPPRVIQLTSLL